MERGWYPDPEGPGERWHDGIRWTGVTRHTPASAAQAVMAERLVARRQRRTRRRRIVVGAALMVLVSAAALGVTYVVQPGVVKPIGEALGIGRPHRLLPRTAPKTASQDYAVLHTDAAGHPVTYDPCKPIHYVVNPDGAPADYLRFIRPAVSRAQAASGLEFVYDGTSSDTWDAHKHARTDEPVLISFTPTLADSAAHPDAVGLGGSAFATGGVRQAYYLTGQIALLRPWFLDASAHHRTSEEQSIVMHELGHVLGLGHVDDPTQVMSPESHGLTAYGDGDLAGLALMGSGHCAW